MPNQAAMRYELPNDFSLQKCKDGWNIVWPEGCNRWLLEDMPDAVAEAFSSSMLEAPPTTAIPVSALVQTVTSDEPSTAVNGGNQPDSAENTLETAHPVDPAEQAAVKREHITDDNYDEQLALALKTGEGVVEWWLEAHMGEFDPNDPECAHKAAQYSGYQYLAGYIQTAIDAAVAAERARFVGGHGSILSCFYYSSSIGS